MPPSEKRPLTIPVSVSIPEDVLIAAKRAARRQRPPCSLSALVTMAVRDLIASQATGPKT